MDAHKHLLSPTAVDPHGAAPPASMSRPSVAIEVGTFDTFKSKHAAKAELQGLNGDHRALGLSKLRLYVFNGVTIMAMLLTLMTYFIVIPLLPELGRMYHQKEANLIQISTSYELGKLCASLVQGWLCKLLSMITLVQLSLGGYAVFSVCIMILLSLPGFAPPLAEFVIFTALYGCAAALSLICQLGLGILRLVNTPNAYKKLIMVQSIAAATMQGLSFLVGGGLLQHFGLIFPFGALAAYALLLCGGLCLVTTSKVRQHCANPAPSSPHRASSRKSSVDRPPQSFAHDCVELCFYRRHRQFQGFTAAVGTATAAMYLTPTICGLLASHELGMSGLTLSYLLAAPFGISALVRIACLVFSLPELSCVRVGLATQTVTCVMMIILTAALPLSWELILAYGLALQLAAGLVIPNCKSGAMSRVPPRLVSSATSLIKMSQLSFALVSALVFSAAYNKTPTPVAIYFLVLTVATLGLLEWSQYSARLNAEADQQMNSGK